MDRHFCIICGKKIRGSSRSRYCTEHRNAGASTPHYPYSLIQTAERLLVSEKTKTRDCIALSIAATITLIWIIYFVMESSVKHPFLFGAAAAVFIVLFIFGVCVYIAELPLHRR